MSETSNNLQQQTLWDTSMSTSSAELVVFPSGSSVPTSPNPSESLPADSPAKTSATQDNELALQVSDQGSGKRCTVSFKKRLKAVWHSITSSWRTSQLSLTGDYQLYSETWPKQGMMQSGSVYELQTLGHPTNESESSLLPTFLASEATHGDPNQKGSDGRPTLTALVCSTWPTPQARDYRSGEQIDSPRMQRKLQQGWSPNLNDTALWSTPAAQDAKNATLPPSQGARDTLPGDLIRQGSKGQLNPSWVECLMGYPEGWTDIDGLLDLESNNTTGNLPESSQENQRTA